MKWRGYLIFGLITVILAPISALCAFFNPVGIILLEGMAAPALRLLGFNSPAGWSSIGSNMFFDLVWPLTLAPLHWLNYSIMRWNVWSYAGLFLIVNTVISFVVLLVNS